MSIRIPVSAELDQQNVEQQLAQFQNQLNELGRSIAQSNKLQFKPISAGTITDMQKVINQFETLKKISSELNKRIVATGQHNKSFFDLDWAKMYSNPATMRRQMASAFQYVTGSDMSPAGGGGGSSGGSGGGGFKRAMSGAAQAGLRATGSAGGVAADAMGSGMRSGFGAGVAGLLGGMLALGVSKIVGAAMEKLDEAEKNSISNDRLKRTLGDVNVSFTALQTSITETAKRNHLLFSEAGQLAQSFAKLGNISERQYKTMADEVGTGVGLSRSLGLDSSVGVSTLGAFRGMRLSGNDQDTRRLALLIGETIGKSDAFAKSGEVMDAMASFAVNQTRMSLGGASLNTFSGYLSAMSGSGIAGLDPANSSAILGRIISTLQGGGGAGEASQFFSARIAQRNGLNPIAGAIWRENPMATVGEAFGGGTAMGQYLSRRGVKVGSGAGGSFMGQTIDQLKKDYKDPWMLLEATSKHLGISRNQAAAMLDIAPNQMGELEGRLGKRFNLSSLNGEAIGTMGKIITGDGRTFNSVADELRSRTGSDALNSKERAELDKAMSSGNRDDKINTLLTLVASRGQESTQGKDIKDSKTALENIKTEMASKLIPFTQDIRTGILYMAGKGEKTGSEVLTEIAEKESELRTKRIKGAATNDKNNADIAMQAERDAMRMDPTAVSGIVSEKKFFQDFMAKLRAGKATKEDKQEYLQQFGYLERTLGSPAMFADGGVQFGQLGINNRKSRSDIDAKTEAALKIEQERLAAELRSIEATDRLTKAMQDGNPITGTPRGSGSGIPYRAGVNGMGSLGGDASLQAAVSRAEMEIGAPAGYLWAQMGVESNYNPNAVSKAGAVGLGQIMPSTQAALEKRFGRKFDATNPTDSLFMMKEVMRENYGKFGNWDDAARAYNGGWNMMRWGNSETSAYVPKIHDRMRGGTPLPNGHASREMEQRFVIESPQIEVVHKDQAGREVMPPQQLQTRVHPATAFGSNLRY